MAAADRSRLFAAVNNLFLSANDTAVDEEVVAYVASTIQEHQEEDDYDAADLR